MLTDVIKIAITLIETTFKDSIKFKLIRKIYLNAILSVTPDIKKFAIFS